MTHIEEGYQRGAFNNGWFRDLTCYGIYDPNFEPFPNEDAGSTEWDEDEVCDRLDEIDREVELHNGTTIYLPSDFSVDLSNEPGDLRMHGIIDWIEEPATQSACNHSRLTESGFGSAYCMDCPAVLRRDDQLNWVVTK